MRIRRNLLVTSILLVCFFSRKSHAQVGTDSTFEAVTWNIEWFGTTSSGPTDETLQLTNAAIVLATLNADFYALQEIRDQNSVNNLVAQLNQNIGENRYRGIVASHFFQNQRMAFIYDTATVDTISTGGLTSSEGQNSNAWAGRLPFFVELDATIKGATRRIFAINIHAKAFADLSSLDRRTRAARDLFNYLNNTRNSDRVLFLGDYNDDVDVSTFEGRTSPYIDFVGNSNYRVLSKILSDQNRQSTVNGPEMIDHITVSDELLEDYVDESISIHEPDYITNYGNTTSDHFPIVAHFNFQVLTSVDDDVSLPRQIELLQNYPNPFNPTTNIQFALNSPQTVSLVVYSITGKEVARLVQGQSFSTGTHSITFDAQNLSSGVYYYRLQTDAVSLTRSMTLLK